MLSFLINVYRLCKLIRLGFKHDAAFRSLFILMLVMLIGATVFYVNFESWSILDAIYFSVMTMTTIGYGDLVPVTEIGKVFTMIYAFLSIGVFVALSAKVVSLMLVDRR